jgi:hypothetical protein
VVTSATIALLRRKTRKPWPPSSPERSTSRYAPRLASERFTHSRPGSSSTSWIGRNDSITMYQNGTTVMITRNAMVSARRVPQTISSVLRLRRGRARVARSAGASTTAVIAAPGRTSAGRR